MTATASALENLSQRRLRASAQINDRASLLDRGLTDTREDVQMLGSLGLIGLGLDDQPLGEIAAVIEDVAAESLSAGFSIWAHRMALEFVNRSPNAVREKFGPGLRDGSTIGATAMSAGLKHAAGLGEVPTVATTIPGGIEISGPIRWASNLFDGAIIVVPVRDLDGSTYVVAIESNAPGIHINAAPELLALNSTASSSLAFDRAFVPAEQIISTDLIGFVQRIKPAFLLLQTAFCSGIARTSLTETKKHLDGLNSGFSEVHTQLADDLESSRERLYRFAQAIDEVTIDKVIELRLDASVLATTATRLEATVRGGAGYAVKSATSRRFREAAFLPIQSPSEGQLRWELAHSS